MKKMELNTRGNINQLVKNFYKEVRKDDLIGSIFNSQIEDWDSHFEKLTDFWETNLLFVRRYKGRPVDVHNQVDKESGGIITQVYFGRWLQLWLETIDDKFTGKNAELAKTRARLMSTNFFLKMICNRQENISKNTSQVK